MSRARTIAMSQTRRDAAEPAVVAAFTALGCSVQSLDRPVDLLIGFKGVTHLVEVKTGTAGYGKRLKASQEAWAAAWRGSPVHVARTHEDAVALVEMWRGET